MNSIIFKYNAGHILSEWNCGMYILQVATDKGSKYVKVMKE